MERRQPQLVLRNHRCPEQRRFPPPQHLDPQGRNTEGQTSPCAFTAWLMGTCCSWKPQVRRQLCHGRHTGGTHARLGRVWPRVPKGSFGTQGPGGWARRGVLEARLGISLKHRLTAFVGPFHTKPSIREAGQGLSSFFFFFYRRGSRDSVRLKNFQGLTINAQGLDFRASGPLSIIAAEARQRQC